MTKKADMRNIANKFSGASSLSELEKYIDRSHKLKLKPRCPIAHSELCPRYYTSYFLLGSVGVTTKIPEDVKSRLDKKWQNFQPTVSEEEASVFSHSGQNFSGASNFCPEVSYETFGHFVSSIHEYPDEIDRDVAHKILSKENAPNTDPRWRWSSYSPKHYSECREFSLFSDMTGSGHSPTKRMTRSRSGISSSVRWQVFARDSFTCNYCGRKPPQVVLEADHKISVANGGSDDIENLVTSCADCNRGKGAKNG